MKAIVGAMLLIVLSGAAAAQGFGCALRPLPPLGCTDKGARCICNSMGICEWVFTDCR